MARSIVLTFEPNINKSVYNLNDYDLIIMICKIIDESLTIDKQLMSLYPKLQFGLESKGYKISLCQSDRLLAVKALAEVIARWSRYRSMID